MCKRVKNLFQSKKLLLYILTNIILVALMIAHTVTFITHLRNSSLSDEKLKFENSVDVINHQVAFYMDNSKRIVRDWVKIIEKNDWSIEEIAEKIGETNSDERIMVMVLSADELSGYTFSDSVKESSYDSDYYALSTELAAFRESAEKDDVYVSSNFTNIISGEQCIAFTAIVKAKNSEGSYSDAFVMRVEPLELLKENWFFSDAYSGTQISMINSAGDYIYRAPMHKNNNFYEYLRSYNDITYPQLDKLRNTINSSEGTGDFIYNNSLGHETLYAYSARGYNNWIIICSIEIADLNYTDIQWSLLTNPLFTFTMLLLLNIFYFTRLNNELRDGMKKLEKANAAKTLFLSSMSHDIRTPMNAIVGLTTIAERNLNDKNRVQNCLEKISLASNHLLTLINDVLDISQVESGKFTINPVSFSIADSAEDLVNIIYPQAEEKNLLCRIHLINITQEIIYADKLRLNQIWLNILSNAVKYTSNGGSIDITLEERDISDKPDMITLIFKVQDTGAGMSSEFIKTIFEPFSREKDSRIDKIQGSGLGMAITKQIIDLMNGKIEVESTEGVGSTFTVTIDLARGKNTADAIALNGAEILLIGENNETRNTTSIVTELGGKAVCAETAEDAIRSIEKSGSIKLVIIDRIMADTLCVDTANVLHRHFGNKCPPMIISAFDHTDIENDSKKAGVVDFIRRPIFRTTFVDKLNSLQNHTVTSDSDAVSDENKQFSGIHLLIAEDNDINWEIISDLLEMHSMTADRAENGSECVRMMREAEPDKYSMIFMDIQMPILNGYEATKEIRKMDDKSKSDIPIIAMTANAFAEDVSACIEAGMNGHIAKPVDLKILLSEIKNYVVRRR